MAREKVRRVERKQRIYQPLTEKEELQLRYPNMTIIGYWGQDKHDSRWPWPQDYVDEEQNENVRNMIVDYLDKGVYATGYMGWSTCRICGCKNGSAELSDGRYVWPEGLSHYVREHYVKLSEEFTQHVIDKLEEVHGLYREDL